MVQKRKPASKKIAVKKLLSRERAFCLPDPEIGPDYDFILWVSLPARTVTVLSGVCAQPYQDLYKKEKLHQQALEQAVQKGIYHYEWNGEFLPGRPGWFQTTCMAQTRPDGRVRGVLCLSRSLAGTEPVLPSSGGVCEYQPPKTFSQILLSARETERREISKALHDEVGSSAVMLRALLSVVKVSIQKGNSKRALRDLEQLDKQLQQAIERLRGIIVSLRPPTLDNAGGLCGAIRDLLSRVGNLSHLSYRFECNVKDEQILLSENVRILLFRIVQEALTNIVKHARAKNMGVVLKRVGRAVTLRIEDDGIGFDPQVSVSIEHVGLLAMKDSVEMLGGKITVKSAPGRGTRIEVRCPSVVYGGN